MNLVYGRILCKHIVIKNVKQACSMSQKPESWEKKTLLTAKTHFHVSISLVLHMDNILSCSCEYAQNHFTVLHCTVYLTLKERKNLIWLFEECFPVPKLISLAKQISSGLILIVNALTFNRNNTSIQCTLHT